MELMSHDNSSPMPTLKEIVQALVQQCREIYDKVPNKRDAISKEITLFGKLCENLNVETIAKIFNAAEETIGCRLHYSFMEHALVAKQFKIEAKSPSSNKKIVLRFHIFLEAALNRAVEEYSMTMISHPEVLHTHRRLMISLLSVYAAYKEDPIEYTNAIKIYESMIDGLPEGVEGGLFGNITSMLGENGALEGFDIAGLISKMTAAINNDMKDEHGNPINFKDLIKGVLPPNLISDQFISVIADSIIPMLVSKAQNGELSEDTQAQMISQITKEFSNARI